jgi:putative membrane protein
MDPGTQPRADGAATGETGGAGTVSDGSAPRRTWLAAERTYLAWVRTSLGALGMALAVGRLLPALADVSHVAFGLLGAAYGVFGVLLLVLAAYRARRVRSALAAQEQLPEHGWTLTLVTGFGLVLAVLTVVLVVVEI